MAVTLTYKVISRWLKARKANTTIYSLDISNYFEKVLKPKPESKNTLI
jgi:hypothetical protein